MTPKHHFIRQSLRGLMLLLLAAALLVGCAEESDPTDAVEAYLKALVESDADGMRRLSCGDWEQQAGTQAASFRAMNATLEGLSCKADGEEGDFTLVSCQGKIVTTYNGEQREWALSTYRLREEGGEWKVCGEAAQ